MINLPTTQGFPIGILSILKTKLQKKTRLGTFPYNISIIFQAWNNFVKTKKRGYNNKENYNSRESNLGSQNIYVMVPEG